MKLLFIADGRSPIALSWIRYFITSGSEVHLISTFACPELNGLETLHTVPVAFSGLSRRRASRMRPSALTSSGTIGLRTFIRHWLGPATVNRAAKRARSLISEIEPDLVHAMRIPFEGALAAASNPKPPLLVSIWGNDFTLHAPAAPMMRSLTRRTLLRTVALHTDNHRDVELASEWGFASNRPQLVLPTNGGVRRDIFYPGALGQSRHPALTHVLESLAPEAPVVVNPRGFRAYVRNDTFFKAIPKVLERKPLAAFLCPNMAGQRRAEGWIDRLQIGDSVHLLPKLTPSDLAAVFRRAQVSVSPSEHDGTPNTLLEAMACGAYPVVGDLQSIREWIEDGKNGTLVDPASADQVAGAIARALEDAERRERAAAENVRLIEQRADYEQGMQRAQVFYEEVLASDLL
ncbi:MAG: glycosyltransferase family 4 protein [Anaerolineales bacterium]